MRNARRSISARNFSNSLVYSRTAPSGAGAGLSQTIHAVFSVSKRGMRIISVPGINAYPKAWLTSRTAQDQQLTHTECDSHCNNFDQYRESGIHWGSQAIEFKRIISISVIF